MPRSNQHLGSYVQRCGKLLLVFLPMVWEQYIADQWTIIVLDKDRMRSLEHGTKLMCVMQGPQNDMSSRRRKANIIDCHELYDRVI